MGKSFTQMARSAELDNIILTELASGVKTTEELRRACIDTIQVLGNHLRKMTHAGLIEGSRPKPKGMKKWRLKKNPTATI